MLPNDPRCTLFFHVLTIPPTLKSACKLKNCVECNCLERTMYVSNTVEFSFGDATSVEHWVYEREIHEVL